MEIAIVTNGKIAAIGDCRALFPTAIFAVGGPSPEWMQENGCFPVSVFKPFNRDTEALVACDPYIEDGKVFRVRVEALPDDIAAANKRRAQAQLIESITASVQARLNAWAAERGYGTEKTEPIVSLCTYATDPSPRLALEGQRGVDMRSATWEACYQILNDVAGGKRPVPTVEDVFDELPALTWPS